ncbi:MAG: glutamine--tRNA ligase/YqeY domain fusion protein [Planctomycetota bacterium]|nr:glutamine--tRNA ligase/YqeY domain fusion protein [Planctomycetota bacterium]
MNSVPPGHGDPDLSNSGESARSLNFVEEEVVADTNSGRFGGRVQTRFPPEPNGYLHIGHAKSICLNFGLARKYHGKCNLRFDDTNPAKEESEYVYQGLLLVRWLGFSWDGMYFASDYFQQLYDWAELLVHKGLAFVCDLTADQMRTYRGTLTEPGKDSPFRQRSITENLDLLRRMRAGEFPDGSRTLRAKIDMASPNLNLRDPVLYRILRAHHHRTGDAWCIYPMYDYAHGQSDSLEGITHSICTLEFEDHRPLYDWFLRALEIDAPRQIEFARLNLTHTVLSKRRLLRLVHEKVMCGWDDPRMPTLVGLRRRGYTPEAIREFCDRIGVAKFNGTIDLGLLDFCQREDLNRRALRVMAVLRPLKIVLTNYPPEQEEWLEAINNPEDLSAGVRQVPFARELWIDQDDFMEDPPKKFFRLSPGGEVRLRYGYIIRCDNVIKDPTTGVIQELHCTYDPESRSGMANAGRKVKGTIHWVSAGHSISAEVRLYDKLFLQENPDEGLGEGEDFLSRLNPQSLEVLPVCHLEPSLAAAAPGVPYQFERLGYFCLDAKDSRPDALVFNRTVTLRDTWAKIVQKMGDA